MHRCANCLSDNLIVAKSRNRRYYTCVTCGIENTKILDSSRNIKTEKISGAGIKHFVVGAIVKKKDKILLLNQMNYPFGLTIPSGHIEFDESVEKALVREVMEETGLKIINKKHLVSHEIIDHCKNGGDIHEWNLFECSCKGKVSINSESSGFIWMPIKDLENYNIVAPTKFMLESAGLIERSGHNLELPTIKKPFPPKLSQKIIIDDLPVSVFILNRKKEIIYANNSANNLFANLKKKYDYGQFLSSIKKIVDRVIISKTTLSSNIKNEDLIYNIVANPHQKKGHVNLISITVKNITDQKAQKARNLLMHNTSLAICSNSSFSNIIRNILKQTISTLNITGCSLMMAENNSLKVAYRYSKLKQKKRKSLELKFGEGAAGWVAEKRTPIAIPDTSSDPLYIGKSKDKEKSLLSLPVISSNKVTGVLNLSKPKNKVFTEDEINVISTIANKIALAIENEQLYVEIKEKTKILEKVLDATTDGIAMINKNREIVFINKILAQRIQLRREDFLTIADLDKKFPKSGNLKNILKNFNQSLTQKKQLCIEINHQKNSKTSRFIFNPIIEKNGEVENVLVVVNDITAIKKKQVTIQKQIDQITALFKISSLTANDDRLFYRQILEKTAEVMYSKMADILFLDKDISFRGTNVSKINKYLMGDKTLISRRGIFFNNIKAFPDNKILPKNVTKIIMTPIIRQEKIIGYLVAINKKTNYNNDDLKLLSIISGRVSRKIEIDQFINKIQDDQERIKNILDNTADGIVVLDSAGKELVWNRGMIGITGYKNLVSYEKNNSELLKLFGTKNNTTNGSDYKEIKINSAEGYDVWLGVTHSAIVNNGLIDNHIYVLRDISKEKEIDDKQKEFIYTATHELRTPITAIKGYLSMILNGDAGKISSKQTQYFSRAYNSTEKLVFLVEDLLKTARLEENKMLFIKEPVNSKKLIVEVCSDFKQKAKDKNLSLSITKSNNEFWFLADYHKTKDAVANLVDNAIKYTKKGKIELILESKNGTGSIIIKDSGVGIPVKELTSIFNKFHRVLNTESVTAGGTGLGLFIVKNLIEKQGGEISVISRLGHGSEFKISFPIYNEKKENI